MPKVFSFGFVFRPQNIQFYVFLYSEAFFCYSELARVLGEKGVIVFSDVEHVILKSMSIVLHSPWLLRKFRKEQNFDFTISKFSLLVPKKWKASTQLCQVQPIWLS